MDEKIKFLGTKEIAEALGMQFADCPKHYDEG